MPGEESGFEAANPEPTIGRQISAQAKALIAEVDRQLAHVGEHSDQDLQVVRRSLAALRSLRCNLAEEDYPAAVESAQDLKHLLESGGGIVPGVRHAGSDRNVTLYRSEEHERQHQYVCRLVDRVKDVAELGVTARMQRNRLPR